ncbi:MAG: hypothetical protein LBV12_06460 [Puniceicoccales bacterium]|nr:hypothetical protein [Puniceicoccales bacterium]
MHSTSRRWGAARPADHQHLPPPVKSARARNAPTALRCHSVKMTVIDNIALRSAILAQFPNAQVLTPFDRNYAVASHEHIKTVFAPEFRSELIVHFGVTDWSIVWDCDKFARHAASLAHIKHALALRAKADSTTPEGMAFGVVCYSQGGQRGLGHAINILITKRGVETWEPQTQEFIMLTPAERESAWLVLI